MTTACGGQVGLPGRLALPDSPATACKLLKRAVDNFGINDSTLIVIHVRQVRPLERD